MRADLHTKPAVSFSNVYKSYDGRSWALRNVNLHVEEGEFFTLLGPSGSGKTTTLMMLAGFEHPTRGEVRLRDQTITRLPPYQREIGMVFQNYALFPHMSVSENIGFPLRVRGRSKTEIQREVGELLELMKLVGLGDRKPVQLSGGQQQRVALARALVFRPRLVLMDEPLGALDKQLREHLQLEIKHIQKKLGVSVVYVTHDQSEALTMSDRIAVFDKGSIQQIASPDALYEKPKSAFVAQFIGENNQIPAVIVSIDGDECCVSTSDGCLLRALAVGVGEVGSPAILSIRPERVIVRPPTRSVGNTFSAIVREVIYHGNEFRVRCDAFTGISFSTRVPNVGEPLNISIGDEIKLGCQISNCRAFPVN